MSETYENCIGGEWRESETGETFDVYNPANPDEVIASVQDSSSADATNTIEAAAAAQSKWAGKPATHYQTFLRETAKRMDDRSSELAETLCQEEGKTLTEASGEFSRMINRFYYYASKAEIMVVIISLLRQPIITSTQYVNQWA